jgi:hypothetical protein
MRFLFLSSLWLALAAGRICAQNTVTTVSQVLPFAATGTVTTTDPKEKPISASTPGNATGSTPSATEVSMAQAGGKISTGADGATSLILGGTGSTARMGADSEVRVPAATEKERSLEMLKGRLFLNISADDLKQRAAGEFRLKTPAALLAVKGTKFFAITQDGADTIGVHEGEVMITTSDGKSSLTLHPGEAAIVKAGQITPAKPFTDDEKAYQTEYPPLLTQMPVDAVAPGQKPPAVKGALLSWSVFKAYDATHSSSFGTSTLPDQAAVGVIRYRFSKPSLQTQLFHGVGNLSLQGKAKPLDQSPPLALLLKISSQGMAAITLAWGGSGERMKFMRNDARNAASAALTDVSPAWVLVPVPTVTQWRATADLRLNVDFDLPDVPSRGNTQEFKAELSEFRFLILPP